MFTVPSWASAALAALIGFAGAWAALRVTVSSLKEDVASLKSLVINFATMQAQLRAVDAELSRARESARETISSLHELSERVARLETISSIALPS